MGETYSAGTIANYFIENGIEEGKPITQLNLLYLVYFSQQVAEGLGFELIAEDPIFTKKIFVPKYDSVSDALAPKGNDEINSKLRVKPNLEDLANGRIVDRIRNIFGLKIYPEIPENNELTLQYLDQIWDIFQPLSEPQKANICIKGFQYENINIPPRNDIVERLIMKKLGYIV